MATLHIPTTELIRPLKILAIPDGHDEPDNTDKTRWTALGNFILETRPDVIVNTGDMFDMPSLSAWDTKKSEFGSRRYWKDIASAREALSLLHAPIDRYNITRSIYKKRKYKPRWVYTMGNHENRINRVLDYNRVELEGALSTEHFGLKERGYEVYPFLKPVMINGVMFNHYFTSGIMGKPVGGVNAARSHTLKLMTSTVSGHSHEMHYAVNTAADGRKIHALIGGCFFDHSHDYSRSSEHFFWRGFSVLHNTWEGEYDLEQKRLETLLAEYL